MMNCSKVEPYFLDVLEGSGSVPAPVLTHLQGCATCTRALEDVRAGRALLDTLPLEYPDPALRGRFYRMLEAEKQARKPARIFSLPGHWRTLAACLVLALAASWFFLNRPAGPSPVNWQADAPVATRITGIYNATAAPALSPEIRDALLSALQNDPNPNVRMAAIDVLGTFAGQSETRTRLAALLPRESSPSVQMALLRSLGPFAAREGRHHVQTFLVRPDLEPSVRAAAQSALQITS